MKCTVVKSGLNSYGMYCSVMLDDEIIATGYDMSECPEDANLMRDLNFVLHLPTALRKAYEAGVNGESFEVEEVVDED